MHTLLLAVLAVAQAQTRVPPDLRKAMDQRIAAVAHVDVATWDRLTADNFVQIQSDGTTRTKTERLVQLRATEPGPATVVTNEHVLMLGNTAVQRYQTPGVWVLTIWTMNRGMWRVTLAQVSPVSGDSATVRQAIDAGLARFISAFKHGDADSLIALYAPNAVQLNPNMPALEGAPAIKQAFTGFFSAMTVADMSLTTHDIIIAGNKAIERGSYAMRLKPKNGGAEIADRGKYVTTWERQPDGSWKIIRDITNTDGASQ